MKKECIYTSKRLARYHAGHLFLLQRRRIERHLAVCAVCSSEFDAVKRIDETQRILRDIAPSEGFAVPLRAGAASLGALRRLLYRPLWMALIVAAIAASYVYVVHPLLHDPDLERLDGSAPSAAVPATPHPQSAATATASAGALEPKKTAPASAAAAPAPSPLMITVAVEKEKEKASIRRINDAMKEHPQLRTMRFSDSVREVSGSLTAGELAVFFERIDGAGKATYKRSRLSAAGEGDLVPFIMRLQTVAAPPRHAEQAGEKPGEKPVEGSVEKPVETPEGKQPAQTDGGASQSTSEGQ